MEYRTEFIIMPDMPEPYIQHMEQQLKLDALSKLNEMRTECIYIPDIKDIILRPTTSLRQRLKSYVSYLRKGV